MPRQLFPTKPKPTPENTDLVQEEIDSTEQMEHSPSESPVFEERPAESEQKQEKPNISPINEEKPEESQPKEEMPAEPNSENIVIVCGEKIEIKPTKVTYFRNKTATTYNLLRDYPLTEVIGIKKGVVDEKRDGDQILYDFLIACLDDKEFVKDHYNDMNADEIEQIIKIVGRLNHTDEKVEQLRKNREAQGSR